MESVLGWVAHYGYVGIFGLLMLGVVGLPIPDETLLMFAGYLIFRHEFAPLPAFAAGFLGSICGITVSYAFGRLLGLYLVTRLGRILHIARILLIRCNPMPTPAFAARDRASRDATARRTAVDADSAPYYGMALMSWPKFAARSR